MEDMLNGTMSQESGGATENEDFDLFAGFDDEGTDSAGDAPTTEPEPEETTEQEPAETEEPPTTAETEAPAGDDPNTISFKAKIDHQEQDVTISASDLPDLYQKARNQERAVQREAQARQEADSLKGYLSQLGDTARKLGFEGETPQAAMEAMLSGIVSSARQAKVQELTQKGTAQEVAEYIADQQIGVGELPTIPTEETPAAEPAEADNMPSAEQFQKDLQVLVQKRPNLVSDGKPFPEEVLQAYMAGENLTVAYLEYEMKQSAAERAGLQKQNAVLKQNQKSAARAPVKGVTGSGDTGGKEDFTFAGFDDPDW